MIPARELESVHMLWRCYHPLGVPTKATFVRWLTQAQVDHVADAIAKLGSEGALTPFSLERALYQRLKVARRLEKGIDG